MKIKLKDLVKLQDIKQGAFIIDVGGYQGKYIEEVLKFEPKLLVYEPYTPFFNQLKEKFKDYSNIKIKNFALLDSECCLDFYIREEGSSLYKELAKSEIKEKVYCLKASDELGNKREHEFLNIDVLKLNCEGSEYKIIDDLDRYDILKNIQEILIQFHKVGNKKQAMEILSKTHCIVYDYKFQLWKRKQLPQILSLRMECPLLARS